MRRIAMVLFCVAAASGTLNAQKIEYHKATGAASSLPFSEAVRVGRMLYLSGQIGIMPGTMQLAPGGISAETRQTMENIRASLTKYGSSLDNVVKCLVILADMSEWGKMNEVYTKFFSADRKPARSSLGASGLALNARVEIECVAVVEN